MAEAFARAYGADIMEVQSAGVSPATYIAPLTKQTLGERNLNIDDHFPKGMDLMRRQHFDVVVNMSGSPRVLPGARVDRLDGARPHRADGILLSHRRHTD